ncbi:MAG TPA: tetratricopeptide repeat protein, partial [Rhodothermales bacterium]|nr:tetratricopeptide repeat protein [Rhodothermales bacterium]
PSDHANIAVTRRNLGFTFLGLQNLAEAEQQGRMAATAKGNLGTYYQGVDLTLLARILVQRRQFSEAQTHLRAAEKLIRDHLPPDHYRLSDVWIVWAEWANAQDRFAEAADWAQRAITSLEKQPKENRNYLADARAAWGQALAGQQKFAEAERVLQQVVAHYQSPDRDAPVRKQKAIAALQAFYRAKG